MNDIKHPFYKDYPEQPYISKERDLKLWESNPEKFPYSKVERKNMVRLDERILPGDVVMLWRIHFDNFTNESVIPQYFEYRYGVNSDRSIDILKEKGFIEILGVIESIDLLNMTVLKRILSSKNLSLKGKKEDLLKRVIDNFTEKELNELISLRKYKITSIGTMVLNKYDDIIKKHGPKM